MTTESVFSNKYKVIYKMVKLRLKRKGRKGYPVYEIIAIDSRARRDGAFLEKLGWYDPNQTPNAIEIADDRALYWLGVGAQPSDTVRLLMSYKGIMLKRHMILKGKTEEEIAQAIETHKTVAAARYLRRKELRSKRIEAKKKAEQAEKAEQEAAK